MAAAVTEYRLVTYSTPVKSLVAAPPPGEGWYIQQMSAVALPTTRPHEQIAVCVLWQRTVQVECVAVQQSKLFELMHVLDEALTAPVFLDSGLMAKRNGEAVIMINKVRDKLRQLGDEAPGVK